MRAARALRGALVTALLAAPLATLPAAPAAAEEVYPRPGDGVFQFEGHGWGHGHGMNQWGAQGAAQAGKTFTTILSTYYPGTTQQTLPVRTIRVLIGEDDHTDVVVKAASGLAVKDRATGNRWVLPSGPTRWRIVADGAGQHVQAYDGSWSGNWTFGGKTSLTGPLQFEGPSQLRLYFANGSARDYRGAMRAVRTGTSTINVVNVLDTESYLLGVVPREASASFHAEALKAQAVAARSYSLYKMDHVSSGATYDICSTTSCQVYLGVRAISASGSVTELEYAATTAAVQATRGITRTYGGKAIFAQFSSSNGGWSVAGSFPYLQAKEDPWDALASPSHSWTGRVTAAQLEARFPAVGRLTRIRVPRRDGNGDWGGRVKEVVLEGVNSSGAATRVTTTGGGVYLANPWPQSATGLRGSWWRIRPTYGATPTSVSSTPPPLVREPGRATATLSVRYKNTGNLTWPTSGLHLAVASPAGAGDPFVGNSKQPGRFDDNVSRPGATSVAPGETARFEIPLDAADVAAGTYTKSYAVRIGTGSIFGSVVTWRVTVQNATFTSSLAGFTGTTATASDGAPPAVRSDGTVVLPRNGSVSLKVRVKNTSNVAWPLNGAVRLAASEPRYRESASAGPEWTSSAQVGPAVSVEGVSGATRVLPGQTAVFPLTLHGNGLPAGLTEESFEAAWFGWSWLSGSLVRLHVVRVDPNVSRLAQVASAPATSLSLKAYPGDRRTLVFRLRNLGGSPWPVAGTEVLGTNPTNREDALRTAAWLSPTKAGRIAANVSRTGAASVYPGEVAEYRVPIDPTNKAAATYGEWFQALDGSKPYGPVVGSDVTVTAATLTASVTRNTRGISVPRAGRAAYTIELKNTGNVPWPVNGSVRLSVAAASPSYTTGWISRIRPSAVDANVTRPGATSVRPGEVARFSFYVAGHDRAPGTYSETFGAGWEAWRSTGLRIPVTYVVR